MHRRIKRRKNFCASARGFSRITIENTQMQKMQRLKKKKKWEIFAGTYAVFSFHMCVHLFDQSAFHFKILFSVGHLNSLRSRKFFFFSSVTHCRFRIRSDADSVGFASQRLPIVRYKSHRALLSSLPKTQFIFNYNQFVILYAERDL